MANNPVDIELIRRITHNDDARAFKLLVERYNTMVWRAAMSLTKEEDMAAEVLQITFIKVWQRLSSWRGENLQSWILVIANHTALDLLEKEKRRRQEPLYEDTPITIEDDYEQKEELLRSLESAITTLPDDEQQLLELYYQQQVPIKDIAAKQGKTPNHIAVKMHQIREKIRKIMNGEQ